MAENDAATADNENQATPEKKGGKLWLIIILLLVVLGAGGGAAWWFLVGSKPPPATDAEPVATSSKPHYLELRPNFVVNLDDPDMTRFLQVDIQLMARKNSALTEVDNFMPEIRNRLLMLLAQQKYESLVPREGKEALQTTAMNEVNAVLKGNGVTETIDALYFTSFVMQ